MPAFRYRSVVGHGAAGVDSITYRQQGLIERGDVSDRHVPDNVGTIGNPNSMGMVACEDQGSQIGEGAAMPEDADDKLGRERSDGT